MGLGIEEQKELIIKGLNNTCYGALRYGWDDVKKEIQFREAIKKLWSIIKEEFRMTDDEIEKTIGIGAIFNIGCLEEVIKDK